MKGLEPEIRQLCLSIVVFWVVKPCGLPEDGGKTLRRNFVNQTQAHMASQPIKPGRHLDRRENLKSHNPLHVGHERNIVSWMYDKQRKGEATSSKEKNLVKHIWAC
jgi:hypothetical protein